MPQNPSPTCLDGIKVLDLSRVLAGPWATQILADLGAEIIKIENPSGGDDTRTWGPPFVSNGDGKRGDAAYYHAVNRGKKSVALDLREPKAQEAVRQLAADADILVENFKTGSLAKYGLDYPTLSALNPRLVYCSITGFGQTGPYRERPGYDFLLQAMGGMMSVTGDPDHVPGGHPLRAGVAISDLFTGMYATVAILAALRHAERTGEGQHLDLALYDVTLGVMANQNQNYLVSGTVPGRMGNSHPNVVPYQDFRTADGYVILAVGNDGQFRKWCKVAGRDDLEADERFTENAGRITNRDALIPEVAKTMATRSSADWVEALSEAGVPCGPINTIADAFADPHIKARGLLATAEHTAAGPLATVRNPIKFSKTPTRVGNAPPMLGEHTEEVLQGLGLGGPDEEVAAGSASDGVARAPSRVPQRS